MADPPTGRCVCQGSATFVKVESLWEEHCEYSKNLEGGQEKLHPLGKDPDVGVIGKPLETFQKQGIGRSPWVTSTHDPLNNDDGRGGDTMSGGTAVVVMGSYETQPEWLAGQ